MPINNLVYPYEASLKKGMQLNAEGDFKGAYPLLVEAANKDSAKAAYLLSQKTKKGSTPQTPEEKTVAASWLKRASDAGFPAAMRDESALIAKSDPQQAASLLVKAAERGDTLAMVNVAREMQGQNQPQLLATDLEKGISMVKRLPHKEA